jgi:hypothetical protein
MQMERLLLQIKELLGNAAFRELVVSKEIIDLKAIFEELLQQGKITKEMYLQIANVFE